MKFYIFKDWQKDNTATQANSIVAHKATSDETTDTSLHHEEVFLPANFFVLLTPGILTQRVDNTANRYKEKQYGNSDFRYVAEVKTDNPLNPVWGNVDDYETHFDIIPGLHRINKKVQKKI